MAAPQILAPEKPRRKEIGLIQCSSAEIILIEFKCKKKIKNAMLANV